MDSEYIKAAGIYKLTCLNNGKIYIGKSIDLSRRLNYHKNTSKKNNGLYYLQNAIIKHGWDSFRVEILETIEDFDKIKDNTRLLERESFYIKLFESTEKTKGYNRCEYSNDVTGRILSEEHKEKIRISSLGRKFSEETRKKISLKSKGRVLSSETKEKMSKSKLGIPSHKKGKSLSLETKEKISRANTGKIGNRLGVKLSDETRKKMSKPKNKQK
jgi:group I intron endonuclease